MQGFPPFVISARPLNTIVTLRLFHSCILTVGPFHLGTFYDFMILFPSSRPISIVVLPLVLSYLFRDVVVHSVSPSLGPLYDLRNSH